MRFSIISAIAASLLMSAPIAAHAADCVWPADKPAKQAYKDIEGKITAVHSKIVYDKVDGQVRKFTYTVGFVKGINPRTNWTDMAKDVPANTIQVGDKFIWQYTYPADPKTGEKAKYTPLIIHTNANGTCETMRVDFTTTADQIGL